ncbi:trafficking protein particle complex subunit 11-like, partial [Anoplophora glabripennis]|uniref:trafficking protein particle complex subunit 11-like n=1 Tax=Anoplophora glabripennis TaxID=217634 RepID=UPI000C768E1B
MSVTRSFFANLLRCTEVVLARLRRWEFGLLVDFLPHISLTGTAFMRENTTLGVCNTSPNKIRLSLSRAEVSLKPMGPQQKLPVFLEIPTSLDANIQTNTTVFVRAHNVGKYHMQIKITYTLDNEKPVFCIKNDKIVILVVQPFDITVRFLTLMMREVESIYVGEEFGVMIYLKFLSSWPIAIEDTLFEFINPVSSTENSSCNQLEGKIFNNEEVGAELRLAICDKPIEQVSNIGQYTIKWRRKDGHSTTTQITICGLPCLWNPLGLKTISPAHGFVRTPMILYYHLQNRSQQLIQLEVSMEGSEAFMFAGYKQ